MIVTSSHKTQECAKYQEHTKYLLILGLTSTYKNNGITASAAP